MRYGIFSDIHGNLQAAEAVISAFKQEHISGYFCVGDIIGYGANPRECIRAVKDLKVVCIAGNHDWAVLGKTDITYFNSAAAEAVVWTQNQLSEEDFTFLKGLELTFKNEYFILVHGTLRDPEHFNYLFEQKQALEIFRLMDRPVCFVAHTHVPGVFLQTSTNIVYSSAVDIQIQKEYRYIVNVGSVGQPRDGNPMASYCIYDTQAKTICVKRIPYDVKEAQKRILDAGLPPFLASRLASGR